MQAPRVAVRVASQQARPGRRTLVALDLADLRAPVTGRAELPLRLFWSGTSRTFDLGDPGTRQWIYETVLAEATRPEDLTSFLNGPELVSIWPKLFLPRGVRAAWEQAHPVLREAPAAPAA